MQQFQKLLLIGRSVNSGCDILTHPTANMFALRLVWLTLTFVLSVAIVSALCLVQDEWNGWSSPVADLLRAATLVNCRLSCGVFPVSHTRAQTYMCTPPPHLPSNALLLNTRFIERKCIITALPFAPHKAAHIKRCLSLMFQQVISGITAKPCSCYLALGVEIIEIFVVSQHSHLNPAKKLVNSAFVFQLCITLHQRHRRRGGTGSGEKVKGAFWVGFLRKRSSRGGIVCACTRVCPPSLAAAVMRAAQVEEMGKLLPENFA